MATMRKPGRRYYWLLNSMFIIISLLVFVACSGRGADRTFTAAKESAARLCKRTLNGQTPLKAFLTGKVLLVDADSYEVQQEHGRLDDSIRAYDGDEIQTIGCVEWKRIQVGKYTDGAAAYRQEYHIKLIDVETESITGSASFVGSPPPSTKLEGSERSGDLPSNELRNWLHSLPVRANLSGASTDSMITSTSSAIVAQSENIVDGAVVTPTRTPGPQEQTTDASTGIIADNPAEEPRTPSSSDRFDSFGSPCFGDDSLFGTRDCNFSDRFDYAGFQELFPDIPPEPEGLREALDTAKQLQAIDEITAQFYSPEGYVGRGNLRYAAGDFDKALDLFNMAIDRDSTFATAYIGRGSVRYERGEMADAFADFSLAVELDPALPNAYNGLATIELMQGNFAEAISIFDTALELDLNYAAARNGRGVALFRTGDFDGALREFDRAISIDSEYQLAANNRATTLLEMGNVDGAIAAFQASIDLDPEQAHIHHFLGQAYEKRGETDQALDAYRRATELEPNHPEYRASLCQFNGC